MLLLAADECLHAGIVAGVRQRQPTIDLRTVEEAGLRGSPDPVVLDWAASEGRVLITGDVNTLVAIAISRVASGEPMPGVFALRRGASMGDVIDDILLLATCYEPDDVRDQIIRIPL
jgi:hypothetical protein